MRKDLDPASGARSRSRGVDGGGSGAAGEQASAEPENQFFEHEEVKARPGPRRAWIERWGPWFGIVVPGLDFVVNGAVSLAQPGYDPVTQYISALSAPPVLYSSIERGWWIVFPILFFPFILALVWRLPLRRLKWGLVALVSVFAVGIAVSGIFPCDVDCRGTTFSSHVHFIASGVTAIALAASPLLLALVVRRDPFWRDVRWINYVFMAVGWAAGIALYFSEQGVLDARGICERVFYGVFYLWFIFVAIHLIGLDKLLGARREPGPNDPRRPAPR